jgi:hypothetical protein
MRAVPFTLERWQAIALQPEQAHEPPTADTAAYLRQHGVSWAYEADDGHTLACGGLLPVGPGEAVAWSYVGADAGPHMLGLIRAARAIMREHQNRWPVIRATVVKDFAAGRRLMDMLGFVPMLVEPIDFRDRRYDVFQRVRESRKVEAAA